MPVSGQCPAEAIPTLWFGMRCDFTRAAIEGALAAGGIEIVAVVLPRGPKPFGAGWPAPPFDRGLHELGAEVIEVDRIAGDDLAAILAKIRERKVALGIGACFPWKVPAAVRDAPSGGVLNIHPSLLPMFPGIGSIRKAFEAKVDTTGVTVHLVDEGVDTGPVILQETIPILPQDTLEALEKRVHCVEHRLYPQAIKLITESRFEVQDNRIRFI